MTCAMQISACTWTFAEAYAAMPCRTWSFQRKKNYAEHNYQLQTAGEITLSLHDKYVSSSIIRYKEKHNLEEVPPPVLGLGRHTRKESNCAPNYITSVDHQSIFASDLKLRLDEPKCITVLRSKDVTMLWTVRSSEMSTVHLTPNFQENHEHSNKLIGYGKMVSWNTIELYMRFYFIG